MLLILITSFAHRAISGIRNGMIYGGRSEWQYLALAVLLQIMCAFAGVMKAGTEFSFPFQNTPFFTGVAFAAFGLSAVCSVFLVAFWQSKNKVLRDIHLWTTGENLFLGLVLTALSPVGFIGFALSVYPSVVVQKIAINLFSGLEWNDERTDSLDGKYYTIPAFGIRVPRMGFKIRIPLAVLSLLIATVLHFAGAEKLINNALNIFKTIL